MSLLYGCMYIIRFGTMRKMHKASSFANEAQKEITSIWWNIWVLLAMPAVWLAWSIIAFLTCIMSFIWLSGSSQDQDDFALSPRAALGSRIGLTVVFALGVIYFVLVVRTFHRYGDPLDREWMRTVNEWTKEALYASRNQYDTRDPPVVPFIPPFRPETCRSVTPEIRNPPPTQVPVYPAAGEDHWIHDFNKLPPSNYPLTSLPSAFFKTPHPASSEPVEPSTIIQLDHHDVEGRTGAYADPKWADAVSAPDWSRFMTVRFHVFLIAVL
ncbi:hypothetical protein B0H12DRAFT_1019704 [Mycena haematopus]|nr:hypothetical protein B0H12DRAFT_1019704 [Mycena haematopus]